jgi:hypothetical protein
MEELHKEIATMRVNMIQSGEEYGLGHPQTIEISQELDELINRFIKHDTIVPKYN